MSSISATITSYTHLQKHTCFIIVIVVIIYICSNGYLFNRISIWKHTETVSQCKEHRYPDTHFRKRIETTNYSYLVYNIQIGKILSQNIPQSQSEEYQNMLQSDLIRTRAWLNKHDTANIEMRQIYKTYYSNFHHNDTVRCSRNVAKQIDFFRFIQFDGERITHSNINFYGLRPIEHLLHYYNESKYYAILPKHAHLSTNNIAYFAPKLFSYTLSVRKNGKLPSLEFRFGEINGEEQHDTMRHLLLNGMHKHLLWAGECWYFWDRKYNKYVMILDNASGHFKPNITAMPHYLETILIQTLFPNYNKNDRNEYKPLLLIGYHEKPWHKLKKLVLPLVKSIAKRDGKINKQKKAEWKSKVSRWKKIHTNKKKLIRYHNTNKQKT